MRVLLTLVAGLYGWSFFGTWLQTQVPGVMRPFVTLRDLYSEEQRYNDDYLRWAQNRTTFDVVREDESKMMGLRDALLVEVTPSQQ